MDNCNQRLKQKQTSQRITELNGIKEKDWLNANINEKYIVTVKSLKHTVMINKTLRLDAY